MSTSIDVGLARRAHCHSTGALGTSRSLNASILLEVKQLPSVIISVLQVLHIDRNNYYGGASASLNLKQVGLNPGEI